MLSIVRRLKIAYSIYNFFHREQLKHNESLYRRYGLRKRYYSPVSSKDFKNLGERNGSSQPVTAVEDTALFKELNKVNQESLLSFHDTGYAIIRNYFSTDEVDAINAEVERLQTTGRLKFNEVNKLMFAIHHSKLLRDIGDDEMLKEVLNNFIGGEAVLFQSINFIMGSEQHTHSDSIHMTTFPLGGLLGAWIALEDVTAENGPLHYYPGSHKLPYYLNSDYDNEGTALLIGDKSYKAYEDMMATKIKEQGLSKEVFKANKGDLLIWHANLFHGGEPHINKALTRKSMVLHYFKKGSICYHEITQRPALIKV